ncbi:tetratricopeptide repeat protein [Gracilibacillus sp. YIM 98692]|uniref:tetratricopeptide repeat protein n=1 Tax=Gracilibacillus sp. YIM 98692 TaxID=2663532 RepID=UPI0013D507CF|nr:tetratricopeptide repeat protein [Gracilibacillus sp. YIM 98692]
MTTIELMSHKKPIELTVQHLTVYKQAKIIEAIDRKHQYYTIIFYKNDYINCKKTTVLKRFSFLAKAFQYGFTYPADHPLTKALLSENKTYRITSTNQMFQKLKDKFAPIEMLYIISMFDNFLEEKKIRGLCKTVFYQYRRNGQLQKAFRTIINYREIRPHDTFAKDMIHHMDFSKYKASYKDLDQLTQSWSDPLYLESICSDLNHAHQHMQSLRSQFIKENRQFDELALLHMIYDSGIDINSSILVRLDKIAQSIITEEVQKDLWASLLPNTSHTEFMIDKLSELNGYKQLIHFFVHNEEIDPYTLPYLEKAIVDAKGNDLLPYTEKLFTKLTNYFHHNHSQLEKVMHITIKKLLPHMSLSEMTQFIPSMEVPITQKLRKMETLTENPDKQMELGEIYFDLEQYDKAIQCFEWEMELNPNDLKPLQYLYKSYLKKDDKEQANIYKKLLINVQSQSASS